MEFSGPEIEADQIDMTSEIDFRDIETQLISELVPLIEHSEAYQYVTLVLVICIIIEKLIKKLRTFCTVRKTKHEMVSDNELPTSSL